MQTRAKAAQPVWLPRSGGQGTSEGGQRRPGPGTIRSWTAGTERELVIASGPLGFPGYEDVRVLLEGEGFTLSENTRFGWDVVGIFRQ